MSVLFAILTFDSPHCELCDGLPLVGPPATSIAHRHLSARLDTCKWRLLVLSASGAANGSTCFDIHSIGPSVELVLTDHACRHAAINYFPATTHQPLLAALSSVPMRGLPQRYAENAMHMRPSVLLKVCLLSLLSSPILGQTPVATDSTGPPQRIEIDDEPSYILEFGAATSWMTTGGSATFAPNFAAETTPIEHWLELEAGVSPFFTRSSSEWDTDLLFKKPWTLSNKAEFMLGVGPQWVYFKQNGRSSNTLTGEVAGDFMF